MVEGALTTTTLLIAVGVALIALAVVVAILLLVLVRRSSRASEARLRELAAEMNDRMKEMITELSASLELAKDESRRNRYLAELAGSIDLDEVLARTLEAAGTVPGVDAALVSVGREDDRPTVVTRGLSAEEASRQAISGPPDGNEARAISLAYQYPPSAEGSAGLIHSGLAVPVPGEGGPIGFLAVYTRSAERRFAEAEIRQLEELAHRAGPAIENARRFREARQLADLDALTGLHNRRYFYETLAREVSRARRYGRQLALIVFDLDDFKAINDRIGHLAGDAVLAETAERVRDVVRSADIACRVGGDEFAVILPESSTADADQLYDRLLGVISSHPVGQAGQLSVSAGIAELREDEAPTAFFERADEALYRAKEHGKAQVVAHGAPFGE
ncbi:MAG TPA: sensor domain-containing diguanylate cyclase [Gaiellaceae bacterium]|nr:sensor domain-containing diguanylate cyclase [Gaiellaceae bacterium]